MNEKTALVPPASSGAEGRPSLHNLPRPATPFVGREAELAVITSHLANPDCRLLTLLGFGGVGKTRLALEAVLRYRDGATFPDGVCWVALEAVTDAALIAPAVAAALGLPLLGHDDSAVQVLNYLRTRQMLLVLDNVEHLLEGAALAGVLLQNSATVGILTTSRERLNLEEEWVVEVNGLEVPPGPDGAIEQYAAVQLFLQRARRVQADFVLAEDDKPYVVRCCQLVQGHPLSIELAAAWTKMLSPAQIVAEIERNLDFLNTSLRNVAERHRSVRAVFERSWKLLDEEERRVCRQTAVFAGGFRREAAEQVAGASLAVVAALADKCLLHTYITGRYEQYRLLWQYAHQKLLEAPGEAEAVAERHGGYYLAFLHAREGQLKGAGQKAALAEIAEEIENIRLAWSWAVSGRRVAEIDAAQESLAEFYWTRDRYQEGHEAFAQAVAALDDPALLADAAGRHALGGLLGRQGWFAFRHGRREAAQKVFERSLTLLEPLADRREQARAHAGLAQLAYRSGDYSQAQSRAQESLALARMAGDGWAVAQALRSLGDVSNAQGRHAEAKDRYQESLALYREAGYATGAAAVLGHLGELAPPEAARPLLEESLALCRAIDDPDGLVYALNLLGGLATARGDHAAAAQLHGEALAVNRRIGDQYGLAATLAQLGRLARATGDRATATTHFHTALQSFIELEAVPDALAVLVELALLQADQGAKAGAVELLAHIQHHPAAQQAERDTATAHRATIAADLAAEVLLAAEARGQARSLVVIAEDILGLKLPATVEELRHTPEVHIEINPAKRQRAVSDITENEFFQQLRRQADELRAKRTEPAEPA